MTSEARTTKIIPDGILVLRGTVVDRAGLDPVHYQIRPDTIAGRQPADVYCISWPEKAGFIPLYARVDFVIVSRPPGTAHMVDIVGIWGWKYSGTETAHHEMMQVDEWLVLGSLDFVRKAYLP